MLRAWKWTALALALVAGTAQASQIGPIGTYYLTEFDSFNTLNPSLDAIRGNGFAQYHKIGGVEGPTAVFTSPNVVRTTGAVLNTIGQEYGPVPSLAVFPTGSFYPNSFSLRDVFEDGTTNGTVNFTVGNGTGDVIATSTTWGGSGSFLFSTGISGDWGITYDATNNSLWIQNSSSGAITDYTLGGGVITSFPTVINGFEATALAMDVDHTLWFADFGGSTIEHYSTTGTYLGSASYAGLGFANGGEIAAATVPEPGSLTLLGIAAVGIVGVAVRSRRKKATANSY